MSTRVAFYEQWLQLMRSWGFTVLEADGWRTRDAEPRTAYDPGQLYVEHHDASTALSGNWGALAYILKNNLANIVTARNGQIMLCAAGIQWHAGVGARPGIPANGANPRSLGNEACNSGSEAYPAAQTLAIIASEAAWAIVAERGVDWIIGHKEWALPKGRKQDPSVDMNQRRRDVAAAMTLGIGEDFMAELQPAEQRRLYNMVMDAFWDGASGSAFTEKAQITKAVARIEAQLRILVGDSPEDGDRLADIWAVLMQLLAGKAADPDDESIDVDMLAAKVIDGMGDDLAEKFLDAAAARLAAKAA